jgi:serine phosphatase RsbU (regulator of sigma subunit)
MEPAQQHMSCMEVWGGSQLTARGVAFGGLDTWVYSKPFGEAHAGGDIYYASSCATGRISRLLLADVAGHGTSVAATAADLRTLMRRFVNRLDQADFVRLLNRQFAALSRDAVFATAIVTTFFEPSRRLTICNAGHPRPFLYRAAQQRWELLAHPKAASPAPSNLPLGLLDITEYEQFDVELEPGDCLLSYTDSLIESRDADGEMLGEDGLLRIVSLLAGDVEPQKLIETLVAEIAQRYPENLSEDDTTVMVIRATGRPLKFSLGDKLRALFRVRGSLPDANLANIGGAIIPALGRRWRAATADRSPRTL